MQLEDYFDFKASTDIRLKGHRIGIETILCDYLELGLSVEEIALRYPTLSLEQICATLTYYWRNREQVDSYLLAIDGDMRRLREEQVSKPSASLKRLRSLAKQRDATHKRETSGTQ